MSKQACRGVRLRGKKTRNEKCMFVLALKHRWSLILFNSQYKLWWTRGASNGMIKNVLKNMGLPGDTCTHSHTDKSVLLCRCLTHRDGGRTERGRGREGGMRGEEREWVEGGIAYREGEARQKEEKEKGEREIERGKKGEMEGGRRHIEADWG